jgi:hypothetical protein
MRVWTFLRGGTYLAVTKFADLNPVNLITDLPIDSVYDLQRTDDASQRSLIAIHQVGGLGATVFDALAPESSPSRRIGALLLEGP